MTRTLRNGLRGLALGVASTLASVLSPLSAQESPTPGERLPVRELELANGMRVLILPRAGAPTVAFVVEFGIGGVHERPGSTGIAHFLEHMLFKGTSSIGTSDPEAEGVLYARMDATHDTLLAALADGDTLRGSELRARIDQLEDSARAYVRSNEFDRLLGEEGARGPNATTDSESTVYFVELPANRAELWFALEADRMRDLVLREFYAERDVVMEERRMRVDTNPSGLLYERHLAEAYRVHPYGQPVVGHMRDLERLTREEVARYYRSYYTPNNAVVAIVGNIDPDRMEALARRYFEPIPRGAPPPEVTAEEPPQREERRVVLSLRAEPQLRLGWHVPSVLHPDAGPLSVLSALLTGGRTSRLYRRLVIEERMASTVFGGLGPGSRDPLLFQIGVTPVAGTDPTDVESVIYEEIDRLAREGPTEAEVERVRNQISAGAVRRLVSNLGLAFQIAESASLTGDWSRTFRASQELGLVTGEEVGRVARLYLTSENRTVATLLPAQTP